MSDSLQTPKYVECQNCGTLHYVISEEESKTLKESGVLYGEFSDRNLTCCVNCGYQNRFSTVSESYANEYSNNDKIPPILLKNEPNKSAETAKSV
jgi:protein-arginine kinase activator protein McsA